MVCKKLVNRVIFLILAGSILSAAPPFAKFAIGDSKIKSNVHILFDLSTSYFNKEYRDRNKKVLKKSFNLVKQVFKRIGSPVKFQVLPITAYSNQSEILCETTFCKKSLFGKKLGEKKEPVCIKEKALESFFSACVRTLMARKPEEATDITGAIDKSVRIARAQSPDGYQTMVILSDFIEWREGLPTPKFKLNDFHILLVYRSPPMHEFTKKLLLPEEEAKKYKRKLKGFGATKVIYVPEEADFGRKGTAADELQ
jgi:hypothetical protein